MDLSFLSHIRDRLVGGAINTLLKCVCVCKHKDNVTVFGSLNGTIINERWYVQIQLIFCDGQLELTSMGTFSIVFKNLLSLYNGRL